MSSNFLQSEAWARLQAMNGHPGVRFSDGVYGFTHTLPLVGQYLYTPRWPDRSVTESETGITSLVRAARESGVGWLRIEPESDELMRTCRQIFGNAFVKAPHDMQPRENFVIDISKPEVVLLAQMKPKARYNIRLAEKHGVRVFLTREKQYEEVFLDLVAATAKRQRILPHPRAYYANFFAAFSEDQCALFVAEYEGRVLAANLVICFGDTAIYMHGGTSDTHREVMAPVLLQWAQIREARRRGCTRYDFGGVATQSSGIDHPSSILKNWEGITRFKMGFAPTTPTTVFPGSYDIILNTKKYWLYDQLRVLQQAWSCIQKVLQ